MIKRVIFDIDDTLIPWKSEYFYEINNELNSLNIEHTEEDCNNIEKALSEYENKYYIFDRKLMLDYINKFTNKQYPEKFIYNLTKRLEKCVPNKIDNNIIEVLDYLKSKYELVCLTDWYGDQQEKRLENIKILKYFSKIYSAEKVRRKPFKEAFIQAIGSCKPEECIMIGDSLERDIKGALNAGLEAIWYCSKEKVQNTQYHTISKLEELKDIL